MSHFGCNERSWPFLPILNPRTDGIPQKLVKIALFPLDTNNNFSTFCRGLQHSVHKTSLLGIPKYWPTCKPYPKNRIPRLQIS